MTQRGTDIPVIRPPARSWSAPAAPAPPTPETSPAGTRTDALRLARAAARGWIVNPGLHPESGNNSPLVPARSTAPSAPPTPLRCSRLGAASPGSATTSPPAPASTSSPQPAGSPTPRRTRPVRPVHRRPVPRTTRSRRSGTPRLPASSGRSSYRFAGSAGRPVSASICSSRFITRSLSRRRLSSGMSGTGTPRARPSCGWRAPTARAAGAASRGAGTHPVRQPVVHHVGELRQVHRPAVARRAELRERALSGLGRADRRSQAPQHG
jgi:hypothetical protein